jgi:hypothetical protein
MNRRLAMFDSLDDQMKHDAAVTTSQKERVLFWVAVAVVSVLLFGGLYFGVRLLE